MGVVEHNRTVEIMKRRDKMGTKQSKPPTVKQSDTVGDETLGLVRRSNASPKEKCILCLDKARKGILCSTEEHFICSTCFSPYVESIVSDAGKMMDTKFTIKCPYVGCSSTPWTSHQVMTMTVNLYNSENQHVSWAG